VERVPGQFTATSVGIGLGDLNHDGQLSPADIGDAADAFEEVLYSQNALFNPSADINADGLVDNRDLYALENVLVAGGANQATLDMYQTVLRRRGDFNGNGVTDAADIDQLFDNLGTPNWLYDMDSDADVDDDDVDTMLANILGTSRGDVNLDGQVDRSDNLLLAAGFAKAGGWGQGDLDGDDLVTLADVGVFARNFGASPQATLAAVPEPSSMATLLAALSWASIWHAYVRRRLRVSRHQRHR
jgi:hypothetical protein